MVAGGGLSDHELLDGIASGDDRSLALLYERYSGPLFDFSVRIVRRPDVAADVVQTTFLKAWSSIQRGSPPGHPKAWLYSIARNEAVDQYRLQNRTTPVDFDDQTSPFELVAEPTGDTSPEVAVHDREMAELVWSAANALGPDSMSLLDMHLRQDLSSEEIATTLGVSTQNAYKKMSRLRESLEEAVADELLRRNRGDCDVLEQLVKTLDDAELTPKSRRAISKHVRSCGDCQDHRERITAPVSLFARFAPIPFLEVTRLERLDRITAEVASGLDSNAADAVADVSPRTPVPQGTRGWSSLWKLAAVVATIVVAAGVVVFMVQRSDETSAQDPDDAASVSHVVGQESDNDEITVTWTPAEGADAYSIEWSNDSSTLPDAQEDLSGDEGSATSPPLSDGEWFFHLRTKGVDGDWTSTVHLGPFVIATDAEPSTAPSATTSTTSTTSSTTSTTTSVPGDGVAGRSDVPEEIYPRYEVAVVQGGPCSWPATYPAEGALLQTGFQREGDSFYRREPGYAWSLGAPYSAFLQFDQDGNLVAGIEPRGDGPLPQWDDPMVSHDANTVTIMTDETRFDGGVACSQEMTYVYTFPGGTEILDYMAEVPQGDVPEVGFDGVTADYEDGLLVSHGRIHAGDAVWLDVWLECSGLDLLVYRLVEVVRDGGGNFEIRERLPECVVVNVSFAANGHRVAATSVSD